MAFEVGSVVARIKADLSDFKAGIAEAKSEASGLGGHIGAIGSAIKDLGHQAEIFTGVVGGIFAVGSEKAVGYASDLQQTRIQLDAFTHSAELGSKAMSILNDFAKDAPLLPLSDIMKAGPSLVAFGLVNNNLSDMKLRLNEVGSLAVASHQPMQTAIDLFAHAKEGILRLQELGQFGISREELSKFGVEFTKTGEAVDKSALLPALQKLTDSKFGSLFALEKNTFAGSVQNIKDDLMRLGAAIVGVDASTGLATKGSIFEKLQNAANALYVWLDSHMDQIKDMVTTAFDNISKYATIFWNALQPLLIWIQANPTLVENFLKGIGLGLTALLIIGTVAGLLFLFTNPLFLVVAAVTALYMAWQTNFGGIRTNTMQFIGWITPFLQASWQIITGIFQLGWAIISGIWNTGAALLKGNWQDAWNSIKDAVSRAWEGIKNIFSGALEFIKGWGGQMIEDLVSPFRDAWNRISEYVNKIKDSLDFTKRHSPSVVDIVQNGVSLVNNALGELNLNANVSPYQVAGIGNGMAGGLTGGMISNQITISMEGALIGDEYSASRMGEKIGDSIIKRLQSNVKF